MPHAGLPLLITGPTASGKSGVALELARRLGGEIVSVDSMQVYRGLDLGTAKPSAVERHCVPHHLLDIVSLDQPFDAAQFLRHATAAMKDIVSRQRLPIFCGGTGLYFKVLLEGIGETPPGDPELRAGLDQVPLQDLLQELAARDPVTFERIDRNNPRRVIRAIEVIRLTGRPVSEQRARWASATSNIGPVHFFALNREREDLRARIDARVDQMFQDGLVQETERLMQSGLEYNRTALQAIGYRQVVEYLRGERSLGATIQLVKQRTHQFAKRQVTWCNHQLPVEWIDIAPEETLDSVASRILSKLEN